MSRAGSDGIFISPGEPNNIITVRTQTSLSWSSDIQNAKSVYGANDNVRFQYERFRATVSPRMQTTSMSIP